MDQRSEIKVPDASKALVDDSATTTPAAQQRRII